MKARQRKSSALFHQDQQKTANDERNVAETNPITVANLAHDIDQSGLFSTEDFLFGNNDGLGKENTN